MNFNARHNRIEFTRIEPRGAYQGVPAELLTEHERLLMGVKIRYMPYPIAPPDRSHDPGIAIGSDYGWTFVLITLATLLFILTIAIKVYRR